MTYTDVTSQRSAALDCLDSAQVYNDLIKRLQEDRENDPARAQQLGRMIGEANASLGVAFKMAEIHASLYVGDAVVDLVAAIDHADDSADEDAR